MIKVSASERTRVTDALKKLTAENPFLLSNKLAAAIGLNAASLSTYLNGTSFPRGQNFRLCAEYVALPAEEQLRKWQSAILGSEQQEVFHIPRPDSFEETVIESLEGISKMLVGISQFIEMVKGSGVVPTYPAMENKTMELVQPEKAA